MPTKLKCVTCLSRVNDIQDAKDAVCISSGHSFCVDHAKKFENKIDKILKQTRRPRR